jgi:hypothetical protein
MRRELQCQRQAETPGPLNSFDLLNLAAFSEGGQPAGRAGVAPGTLAETPAALNSFNLLNLPAFSGAGLGARRAKP